MKLENIKIGQRVVFDGGNYPDAADAGVVVGFRTDMPGLGNVWVMWDSDGSKMSIDDVDIEPEHVPTQQPSLANTKIDVQKYADTYGLTLEQAHHEVQPWLFEQGYNWGTLGSEILATDIPYLYVRGGELLHGNDEHRFYEETVEKEITLLRNVSVSLSVAPSEPSVELDGKQYTKAQLLGALAKLEGK